MPSQKRILTPEQLALSEARKRRKAEAAALAAVAASEASEQSKPIQSLILPREFVTTGVPTLSPSEQTTIMSWNVGRNITSQMQRIGNI